MDDSRRKQVLDAVMEVLKAIPGIGKVSTRIEAHDALKPGDFPALFPIDGDAQYSRLAFADEGAVMECELTVVVTGYVFDARNELAKKRTDLIAAVEVALTADPTLGGVVRDVMPDRLTSDNGVLSNYSIFDFAFRVEYEYFRSEP